MIRITTTKNEDIIIPKAWGREIIIHNSELYCGKLLQFKKGGKFSLHYHSLKTETWVVNKGSFKLTYVNTRTAEKESHELIVGDIIHIKPNLPHQLMAYEESEIFEVSTPHYDEDSYRIEKGDSQL